MLRSIVTAALVAGITLVPTTAAQATAAPCVSAAEYKAATIGKTKLNTHRLFGTAGWRIDYVSSRIGEQEHRGYNACNGDKVFIEYSNPVRDGIDALRITHKDRGTPA